jgi:hypothetical protein
MGGGVPSTLAGAGSGNVSHPRALSRNAACCNCGSGGASFAASLPGTWVCARSVSQVARHCAYDGAGQPQHMTERYPVRPQTLNQPLSAASTWHFRLYATDSAPAATSPNSGIGAHARPLPLPAPMFGVPMCC